MPASRAASRRDSGGVDVTLLGADATVIALATRPLDLWMQVFLLLGVLAMVAMQGGYRRQFSSRSGRELPRVVIAVATAAALVGAAEPDVETSSLILASVLPTIAGLALVRLVLSVVVRLRRAGHRSSDRALVVGAGLVGQRILRHLRDHPEYGLSPVGFVDDSGDGGGDFPVLGRVEDLERVIGKNHVTKVIVAFGITREDSLVSALRSCDRLNVDFWVVPRFFEMGLTGGRYDDEIWGLPLVRMRRPVLGTAQWRMKRAFDLVVAPAGLVVLAPVFLAISVAIRLGSPGPVFFRQMRVGQRGVAFDVLKFRTMMENDDDSTTWSVSQDQRVTPIGRLLRTFSIDELPQLLNVVRGDMSLVGPRPERPHFVAEFSRQIPRYGDRHRVPVGMTGLAQVNGLRGDTSIEERSVFDNLYIETWSLWGDIIILFRTIGAVLHPPRSVRMSRHPSSAIRTRLAWWRRQHDEISLRAADTEVILRPEASELS